MNFPANNKRDNRKRIPKKSKQKIWRRGFRVIFQAIVIFYIATILLDFVFPTDTDETHHRIVIPPLLTPTLQEYLRNSDNEQQFNDVVMVVEKTKPDKKKHPLRTYESNDAVTKQQNSDNFRRSKNIPTKMKEVPQYPATVKNVCEVSEHDFRIASGLFCIVTGTEYSGTTTVYALITSHPNLMGGEELGFLLPKTPQDFPKSRHKGFYNWLDESKWGISEKNRDLYIPTSQCYADMYRQLHQHSTLYQNTTNRWIVDKTPAYIRNLKAIMDKAPHVPVIVTVKSDEHQYQSIIKRHGNPQDAWKRIQRGKDNIAKAMKHYPDRIHVVQTEQMYVDPSTTMKEVYKFLKLDEWNPSYLTMETINDKRRKGGLHVMFHPFDIHANDKNTTEGTPKHIGQW